jgi:hypothetical protein
MASSATPYGLKPVKKLGGEPWNGAFNTYLIDPAGEATNIFNGQVVQVGTDGYIAIVTDVGSNADPFPAGTVGVFVGCEYVNAQGQLIHSQYYPSAYAAPTGTAIKAFVVDDPDVLFQAQLDASSAQTVLGGNVPLAAVQSTSTGSTTTGNSTSALDADDVATATVAFKIVGFVSPIGDAYPDVLVKFNPSSHAYLAGLGVAD